jgi:hypothetical protein
MSDRNVWIIAMSQVDVEREAIDKLHKFLLDNKLIITADTSSGTPKILLEDVGSGVQVYVGRRVPGGTQDRGEVWNNPGY